MITLDFPMQVHMIAGDPRVRENTGKVAFMRGPVTFCAESIDNGEMLHLLRVDEERVGQHCKGVIVAPDIQLGHRTVKLTVPGLQVEVPAQDALYTDATAFKVYSTKIQLIPYYAWANRERCEMSVWLFKKLSS